MQNNHLSKLSHESPNLFDTFLLFNIMYASSPSPSPKAHMTDSQKSPTGLSFGWIYCCCAVVFPTDPATDDVAVFDGRGGNIESLVPPAAISVPSPFSDIGTVISLCSHMPVMAI